MQAKTEIEHGLEQLRRLEAQGATFVPVHPNSKQPKGEGWQHKPYTVAGIESHLRAGGNVGLLAGAPSNGLCVLDLDVNLSYFIACFPEFRMMPRLMRVNAPERGKFIIRITDGVPPPRKWRNPITNALAAEWLSTGNQAVLPPSMHPGGEPFFWAYPDNPIPEFSTGKMEYVWRKWTKTPLIVTPEPPSRGRVFRVPSSHVGTVRPDSSRAPAPAPAADLKEEIRRRFDMVRYACEKLNTTAVRESASEYRVLGQGGLLIDVRQQIWNTFATDGSGKTGGDCFDLVSYLQVGAVRLRGQDWKEVLRVAAEYVGIKVEEGGRGRGNDPNQGEVEEGGRGRGNDNNRGVLAGIMPSSTSPSSLSLTPTLSLPMAEAWNLQGSARLVWEGWMEAGLITLIGGVPNVGKSPLLLAIVAGYLRGEWPDGTPVPEFFAGRNVVYYLPEGFASQTRFLRDWGLDEATVNRVPCAISTGHGQRPQTRFCLLAG